MPYPDEPRQANLLYCAPELKHGSTNLPTIKSEVYSLDLILWFCISNGKIYNPNELKKWGLNAGFRECGKYAKDINELANEACAHDSETRITIDKFITSLNNIKSHLEKRLANYGEKTFGVLETLPLYVKGKDCQISGKDKAVSYYVFSYLASHRINSGKAAFVLCGNDMSETLLHMTEKKYTNNILFFNLDLIAETSLQIDPFLIINELSITQKKIYIDMFRNLLGVTNHQFHILLEIYEYLKEKNNNRYSLIPEFKH